MQDERIALMEQGSRRVEFESNPFSDAVVGMGWGIIGSSGVVLALAGVLAGLELVERGATILSGAVGWAVATIITILFAGVGVGASCGFIAGAVSHYATSAIGRAVTGALSSVLFVVLAVAIVFEGDLTVLLVRGADRLFLGAIVLAVGAGVMAGVNCGREIGA